MDTPPFRLDTRAVHAGAGGADAARRLVEGVRLLVHGPSLGGVESLIVRPATMSHAGLPREEREALGVGDARVRVSAGIEAAGDLIADLDRALGPGPAP